MSLIRSFATPTPTAMPSYRGRNWQVTQSRFRRYDNSKVPAIKRAGTYSDIPANAARGGRNQAGGTTDDPGP